ncbi:MAG: RluA family pseudouridine synthase [Gammaproteobacteria bacterium]|nr:RluA family pseudouridine synthase [Gammaproteobacteria bacterium]
MSQPDRKKSKPENITVGADQAGRRIDNFLISRLGRIPKSRIYQMLRRGEVRVNGGRIKPDYRLQEGDDIRIPPLYEQLKTTPDEPPARLVEMIKTCVIYEDERLVVINKPASLVVHAGSGSAFGVIELLRALYRQEQDLHLIHRLDKETSGCLLIAKNMVILRQVNHALKNGDVRKEYDALLRGRLHEKKIRVNSPLQRHRNQLGEGRVRVEGRGKTALSEFKPVEVYSDATHVKVRIGTGRTHQIRVHAASIGHPVAGDGKYGNREFNRKMRSLGLKRMFLHAGKISVPELKATGEYQFSAPLPADLEEILKRPAHQSKP